jgi:hypothetical protein
LLALNLSIQTIAIEPAVQLRDSAYVANVKDVDHCDIITLYFCGVFSFSKISDGTVLPISKGHSLCQSNYRIILKYIFINKKHKCLQDGKHRDLIKI